MLVPSPLRAPWFSFVTPFVLWPALAGAGVVPAQPDGCEHPLAAQLGPRVTCPAHKGSRSCCGACLGHLRHSAQEADSWLQTRRLTLSSSAHRGVLTSGLHRNLPSNKPRCRLGSYRVGSSESHLSSQLPTRPQHSRRALAQAGQASG